jgi:hypothetical protein
MTPLSLSDLMGTLHEASGEFKYTYQLSQDELDWVLGQLDMSAKKSGEATIIVDNDDQEDNQPLGKYSNGTFDTDIKLQDYVDLKLYRRLKESTHLKKDGSLDFRRLLGKATKKYQALLIVQGTYGSPVAGDEAGSPTQADSPSN